MSLKGKAKTDYQREYMRRRRGSNKPLDPVRPLAVRPIGKTHTARMGFDPKPAYQVDAEGNPIYE